MILSLLRHIFMNQRVAATIGLKYGFSSALFTRANSSGIAMCCGHFGSQRPHRVQREASPGV
jgi:hypothetical protein